MTLAKPAALVVAVGLDRTALAPPPGTVKVTVTLGSGLLLESFTRATSGLVNAVLITVVCGLPELTVTPETALLVSAKVAAVATPVTLADTLYDPDVPLAVAVMLARPEALVVAVAPDRTALAPLAGAAKVTVTLGSGLLPASFTSTTNGLPNAVLTFVVCGLPELTAMEAAAAPLMSSVRVFLKVAEFASVTVRFTEFEPTAVGVPVI